MGCLYFVTYIPTDVTGQRLSGSADLKKGDEVGEQRHARGDIGRYPIPKKNAVSVFRRFLTGYIGIFSRYCGI